MTNHVQEARLNGTRRLLDIFNKSRSSSLYNNAFYLMINNITTSLLGFIFWNIMARLFPPAQVGIGSSLVAASSLLGILTGLGLRIGLIRFVPETKEKVAVLVNTSFSLVVISSLTGALIYLAGVKIWSPALSFVRDDIVQLLLFLFFTAATTLSGITDGSLIAGRVSKYVFWKNTLISIIKLPLPMFVFTSLGGFGIFAGTGASVVAGLIVSWLLFLPRVYKGYFPRPVLEIAMMRRVLPYSFANYMANLLNLSPQFIYPLMVLNVLGPENSAYFYIAWMMTMVLAVIPNGVAQSLFAEGSHDPTRLGTDGRRILLVAMAVSVPAAGSMMLLCGWMLHFFGPGYAEHGTTVVRYLAFAIIPQCVNALFITVNQVRKQIKLIIAQTGYLAIVALGIGYYFLKIYGLPGVGMAYALAHLSLALVVVWPLIKDLKEK